MKSSAADIYEIAMGRWSRRLARAFLAFVEAPAQGALLDVGCGTGSLTLAAATRYPDANILGIDLLSDYLHEALMHSAPNARFETADATALPYADHSFEAAFSQLVLNDLEDSRKAVDEMVRVTRPGGVIAATVWDRAGGLGFLRLFLDATAVFLDQPGEDLRARIFDVPHKNEDDLIDLWADAGLKDVNSATISIRMDFLDFGDYWDSLMGAHSLIPKFIGELDIDTTRQLEATVRRAYQGGAADGRRSLVASALAVRGIIA
ncbi:class I SAM-dependent methyltransferase [Thalassospira sp.]|uniref:class I SAM-dependent methyltransferase n=1 Tax=Thalassospira sp. TaxID=1912094 RepID=UPI0027337C86|nr:class I SAM-dependent methyltransferase [Thalassospira sp.]MDP2696608.1 class I SAM-dependent methyltransferase [Thalassospira sp.]